MESFSAAGLGVWIFLAFAMVASVINIYTSTGFHTCLDLWARTVEAARTAGQPIQVATLRPWQLC